MSVEAPERIWIESEGGCPYFYHEEELSDVGSPITEYVRADKLEELAASLRVAQGNTDAAIEDYNDAKAALAEKDKEIADLTKKFETLKRAYDRERRRLIQILGSNAGGKDAK